MQRLKALQRLASRAKHPSSFSGKNDISLADSYRCFAAQPDAASSADEDLIEVIVNGRPVSVPKGSNVLQACEAGGVDIPRYEFFLLCHGSLVWPAWTSALTLW
jgi:hypothetical protein